MYNPLTLSMGEEVSTQFGALLEVLVNTFASNPSTGIRSVKLIDMVGFNVVMKSLGRVELT